MLARMKRGLSAVGTHTFSKVILTFLAILTASLLMLGTFSFYAYRTSLLEKAVESGQTTVDFIMEQVDAEIKNLHYATLNILDNSDLKSFEYYTKDTSPDALFKLKDMKQEIHYLENSYPALKSIWLYSCRNQLFFDRYGCFGAEEFFGKRVSIQQLSGVPLADILDEVRPFEYFGTAVMTDYYQRAECISFIRTVTDYSGAASGQIILNINSSVLANILQKAASRQDLTVLLLDDEGTVITASANNIDGEALRAAAAQLAQEDAPDGRFTLGGEDYTGWMTYSSQSGLRCLALVNRSDLLAGVNYIRVLTTLLVAVSLLLGTAVAFWLTNRLFAPIRKIVQYVEAELAAHSADTGSYRDVFLIEKFLAFMKAQNKQLQTRIDSYADIMQEVFLTELLYSREQPLALETYQKVDLQRVFPHRYYIAGIIPLEQPGAGERLSAQALEAKLCALAPSGQPLRLYTLSRSEQLLLIVNTAQENAEAVIAGLLSALRQAMELPGGLLFAYGTGYDAYSGLYDSFHQAINALMVKRASASVDKDTVEQAIKTQYITSDYTQEMESRLIRLVKSRNAGEAAWAMLTEIIESNRQGAGVVLKLESLFVQLVMTVNRVLAEMNLDGADIFGMELNHYRVLDRYPTLAEKEQYILGIYDKLITYVHSARTGKTGELYQAMLDYVADHYATDLSLNDISYQLELSPSYLSNLFKEYHNTTFLDYVNNYRIAKAKPLLLNTEESVAAIAQRVGYGNVNTFIRIFKKSENITPGQYRFAVGRKNS